MANYPKSFDNSKLTSEDKLILSDFYERREIFDVYLQSHALKIFTCPGCSYPTLGERGGYEICPICGWEDDNQDDPKADEVWGGPNSNLSLTENRLKIGGVLKDLAQNLNSEILSCPEEVIKAIGELEAKLSTFLHENIRGNTNINDSIWEEWENFRRNSLLILIKK